MLQKYTQKRSGVFQGCKTIMSYLIFEIQYDNIALLQILKKPILQLYFLFLNEDCRRDHKLGKKKSFTLLYLWSQGVNTYLIALVLFSKIIRFALGIDFLPP